MTKKALSEWILSLVGALVLAIAALVWSTKADSIDLQLLRKDVQTLQKQVDELEDDKKEDDRRRAEEAQRLLEAYRAATGRDAP